MHNPRSRDPKGQYNHPLAPFFLIQLPFHKSTNCPRPFVLGRFYCLSPCHSVLCELSSSLDLSLSLCIGILDTPTMNATHPKILRAGICVFLDTICNTIPASIITKLLHSLLRTILPPYGKKSDTTPSISQYIPQPAHTIARTAPATVPTVGLPATRSMLILYTAVLIPISTPIKLIAC